ncbi:MAG: hypothetical protein IT207_10940 [Fimbriimonadaceae bacterium]|nr:hypothetical protein [Fimbriimonadaceae bacterium]
MLRNVKLTRLFAVASLTVAVCALGTGQLKQAIKIIGVGAAVTQFGPEMNRQLNKLTGHTDTEAKFTRVVPIITIGLNTRGAIGAAQVMGSKKQVMKVKAVAQPEVDLFGEVKLRAMIPVSDINVTDPKKIKAVDGVGVSGVVDLKL